MSWDGVNCIEKRYLQTDRAEEQCCSETGFYLWYRGLDTIPCLIDTRSPEAIVITEMPGRLLSTYLGARSLDAISHSYGLQIARFFNFPLRNSQEIRERYFHGMTATNLIAKTVAAARSFIHHHALETLATPFIHDLQAIEAARLDAEPECLCKLELEPR